MSASAALGIGTFPTAGTDIMVLNGPNLNRLGQRQPEVYGSTTLADVEAQVQSLAAQLGLTVGFFQSNFEGALIDCVHACADHGVAVIINPGGLTHTSVALRDALAEVADGAGFVEVHISNVHAREQFRHHSYLSPIARAVIAGCGVAGYELALRYLAGALPRG
ncbi:type II 3-dehydroquinate dehydratase [Corynebacterium sp. 13CS0277]|uniref:type II 3-dehydroquinate dehydratase n=1 Tax=Corynebacterium sp. 13CS0277 TaxID=2071994 RepID=UPI000D03DCDD|nr:type II 3-dehydroquinate dehydratase [Corynebacterium sp. 13CS0277]PRQ11955.1 type II 3-dehydroquinate dehydratase [Corynebacterium sp. 13CS0277]